MAIQLSVSVRNASLSAAGVVVDAGTITGSLAQTLGAASLAAVGTATGGEIIGGKKRRGIIRRDDDDDEFALLLAAWLTTRD